MIVITLLMLAGIFTAAAYYYNLFHFGDRVRSFWRWLTKKDITDHNDLEKVVEERPLGQRVVRNIVEDINVSAEQKVKNRLEQLKEKLITTLRKDGREDLVKKLEQHNDYSVYGCHLLHSAITDIYNEYAANENCSPSKLHFLDRACLHAMYAGYVMRTAAIVGFTTDQFIDTEQDEFALTTDSVNKRFQELEQDASLKNQTVDLSVGSYFSNAIKGISDATEQLLNIGLGPAISIGQNTIEDIQEPKFLEVIEAYEQLGNDEDVTTFEQHTNTEQAASPAQWGVSAIDAKFSFEYFIARFEEMPIEEFEKFASASTIEHIQSFAAIHFKVQENCPDVHIINELNVGFERLAEIIGYTSFEQFKSDSKKVGENENLYEKVGELIENFHKKGMNTHNDEYCVNMEQRHIRHITEIFTRKLTSSDTPREIFADKHGLSLIEPAKALAIYRPDRSKVYDIEFQDEANEAFSELGFGSMQEACKFYLRQKEMRANLAKEPETIKKAIRHLQRENVALKMYLDGHKHNGDSYVYKKLTELYLRPLESLSTYLQSAYGAQILRKNIFKNFGIPKNGEHKLQQKTGLLQNIVTNLTNWGIKKQVESFWNGINDKPEKQLKVTKRMLDNHHPSVVARINSELGEYVHVDSTKSAHENIEAEPENESTELFLQRTKALLNRTSSTQTNTDSESAEVKPENESPELFLQRTKALLNKTNTDQESEDDEFFDCNDDASENILPDSPKHKK